MVKQQERQILTHWRGDADLAAIRDQPALDLLSENERAAWQTLWADVAALLQRARQQEPNSLHVAWTKEIEP